MAYKVFSNGDALTGSELNTYLMNQSVMVFASTTARDAALTAPTEGMVVWLQDANKYVYYTGSAWADLITPASSGNAIINGAFDIWQRGTSFSSPANGDYTADRWKMYYDGTGATRTISRQTFTPGTAPIAVPYFFRYDQSAAGSGSTINNGLLSKLEDVNTFAGQTVTLSFYAKAAAGATMTWDTYQEFGSGGSSAVLANSSSFTLTTSWQRFTATFAMASLTGKTIGTGSSLTFIVGFPKNATGTYDFTGLQLESGSTATAFKLNGVNIQGELAACQRYAQLVGVAGVGMWYSSTTCQITWPLSTWMRAAPSATLRTTTPTISDAGVANRTGSGSTIGLDTATTSAIKANITGFSGATNGRVAQVMTDGMVLLEAEL